MIVLSRKMGEKIIDNLAGLDQPLRTDDPSRSGFFSTHFSQICQHLVSVDFWFDVFINLGDFALGVD